IATYSWSLIARPAGSAASLIPSSTVAEPTLLLDVPGTYMAELTVYDSRGDESCTTSVVTIEAVETTESGAVAMRLTWDTDNTDLDLHYRHANAVDWNDPMWVC